MSALATNAKPSSFASNLARSALDVSTTVKAPGSMRSRQAIPSPRSLSGLTSTIATFGSKASFAATACSPTGTVGYDVQALRPQQRSNDGAGYVVVVDE